MMQTRMSPAPLELQPTGCVDQSSWGVQYGCSNIAGPSDECLTVSSEASGTFCTLNDACVGGLWWARAFPLPLGTETGIAVVMGLRWLSSGGTIKATLRKVGVMR